MVKKILNALAILLLLLNGTGALFGGWSMIKDPSGADLKMPLEWLHYTPFHNFLIPGIILFIVNGIFSLIAILLIIIKPVRYYWYVSLEGCLLTGWIIGELFLTRMYHPLQAILGIAGLLLIAIGVLLSKINNKQHLQKMLA